MIKSPPQAQPAPSHEARPAIGYENPEAMIALPERQKIPFALIILIPCLFYLITNLHAQHDTAIDSSWHDIRRNTAYLEFLGNGVIFSFNYDRLFPLKEKLALFGRIGVGEYHGEDLDGLNFNLVVAPGILCGVRKHFFESSIAYTYMTAYPDNLVALTIGYRFQGLRGFVARVTPMYIYNTAKIDSFGNTVWFGFSLGWAF